MRMIFFILGWVFFVIGAIGAFVPLLPTTPFIILAAACFSKSSERFYNWLIDLPVMGPPLRDWKQHKVIGIKAKILASIFISSAVTYVGIFSPVSHYVKAAMLIICSSVLTYIWLQKSKKQNQGEYNAIQSKTHIS